MTTYLADSNVLIRWALPGDPEHDLAVSAVDTLLRRGGVVVMSPQNLVEFWNAATRPPTRNGLGFSPARADLVARGLEQVFGLVVDVPEIHEEWRNLVVSAAVSGKQVHDARLAAVMIAHGISHILTFNTGDFERYPGITAVHPAEVVPLP